MPNHIPGGWYPMRGVDYSLAKDNEALIERNARNLIKICKLTEENVGLRMENDKLRMELAALKAPPPVVIPVEFFPVRALNRRTHSIGLVSPWG